jgi:hypothetical protein
MRYLCPELFSAVVTFHHLQMKNAKKVMHKQGRRIIYTMKGKEGDEDKELAQPLTDFYGHLATPVNLALHSMT